MKKAKTKIFLKFKNYPLKVKNCLNPVLKKKSDENVFNNSKEIKDLFASFNSLNNILTSQEHTQIQKENDIFQKNMDTYHTLKTLNSQNSKKDDEEDAISEIIEKYYKKGYKVPDIYSKNIFNRNPLNLKGISLQSYYEQISLNQKNQITDDEKNLVYLRKTSDFINSVKNLRASQKQGYSSLESESNKSSEKKLSEKKKSRNLHSRKNINKKRINCLTSSNFQKEKNNNKLIDENKKLEKDENNELKKLSIEVQDLKKNYNFVLNDFGEIDFFKSRNFSQKNFSKRKQIIPKAKKTSLNNLHDKSNLRLNIFNRRESKLSSKENNIEDIPKKNVTNFNLSPKINENTINTSNIVKKNSFILDNKERNSCINLKQINNNSINNNLAQLRRTHIKQKTQFFSLSNNKLCAKHKTFANVYLYDNNNQQIKNKINSISNINLNRRRNSFFTFGNNFHNFHNNFHKNFHNNLNKFRTKEELLNYLFKNVAKSTESDENFISAFKKYFLKHTKISENKLNKFIKKKYEPNDFINFCTTIEKKVLNQNTISVWKRNFTKLDKLIERKNLFRKADKIDYYILHLYQTFISAIEGQRRFIELQ